LIYADYVADAVSRALFADKPLSRAYNIGLTAPTPTKI
jgi:hypothetical protein